MLVAMKYTLRGERTKERLGAMMSVFGEKGEVEGTIAHYSALDGSFGLAIIDSDDHAGLYQLTLTYQEWLDIEFTPIITVEDAMPHILEALAP